MGSEQSRPRSRDLVSRSSHAEEYERLLRNGWSSTSLERYAAHRFGEQISSASFRRFRARKKITVTPSPFAKVAVEDALDVVAGRAELIQLQRERIGIDVEHERSMNKLFGSTRGELRLLGDLLTEHLADLQALGLMPRAGDKLEITAGPAPGEAPKTLTLGELLGTTDGETTGMARVLHLRLKEARSSEAVGAEGLTPSLPGPVDVTTQSPTGGTTNGPEALPRLLPPAPAPGPPALGRQGGQARRGPALGPR